MAAFEAGPSRGPEEAAASPAIRQAEGVSSQERPTPRSLTISPQIHLYSLHRVTPVRLDWSDDDDDDDAGKADQVRRRQCPSPRQSVDGFSLFLSEPKTDLMGNKKRPRLTYGSDDDNNDDDDDGTTSQVFSDAGCVTPVVPPRRLGPSSSSSSKEASTPATVPSQVDPHMDFLRLLWPSRKPGKAEVAPPKQRHRPLHRTVTLDQDEC